MAKPKIAVIISTIRVTRFGEKPAKWKAMLDELHWWASALMIARAASR